MRIRLLRAVPSSRSAVPFAAGHVIVVSKLTAEMRRWLKDGLAVIVAEQPETAMMGTENTAMLPRGTPR